MTLNNDEDSENSNIESPYGGYTIELDDDIKRDLNFFDKESVDEK